MIEFQDVVPARSDVTTKPHETAAPTVSSRIFALLVTAVLNPGKRLRLLGAQAQSCWPRHNASSNFRALAAWRTISTNHMMAPTFKPPEDRCHGNRDSQQHDDDVWNVVSYHPTVTTACEEPSIVVLPNAGSHFVIQFANTPGHVELSIEHSVRTDLATVLSLLDLDARSPAMRNDVHLAAEGAGGTARYACDLNSTHHYIP